MYTPSDDDALILEAAGSGDLEILQQLEVRFGGNTDFRRRCDIVNDCEGRRPLHYAAENGFIHICKFLIDNVKVDINIKSEIGDTPLLNAVAMGNISTAKYLLIRGADITIADSKGMTSLHYAAEKDNRELMRMLLLRGAEIESNSVLGTPLQCAASRGNVDSVRFLLGHGAKPNPVSLLSHSPLVSAISSRSFQCLELLLKAGANPNISSCGVSPLVCAAMIGNARVVKSLLSAGANPNSVSTFSDGDEACPKPIEYAAHVGNPNIVKILFPLTEKIPSYPDWTIRGITNYFHTEEAKTKREESRNAYFQLVVEKGQNAMRRKYYSAAVKWFSEAIYMNPSDARIRSNRSICWAKLTEPAFALYDAEACVELRPESPEAHYREGVAWMLLKNYAMASGAFIRATRLDPRNEKIGAAYREAVDSLYHERLARQPLETLNMIRKVFG
ncbi:hypothetical protein ABFX02_04G037400 [Erythranthe guttata]